MNKGGEGREREKEGGRKEGGREEGKGREDGR